MRLQVASYKLQVCLACILVTTVFLTGVTACAPADTERSTLDAGQLTVTSEQLSVINATSSPTPPSTSTPQPPTPTPLPPTPTPCPPDICNYAGHFHLSRPIAAELVDVIDPTYRYGSTQDGLRETHIGVEFVNPQGTPVLAAADGVVIVAGNDYQTPYAAVPGFYGNLVIIEHNLPGIDEPVFTLYGHLYEIHVEVDQHVNMGESIGTVGFTGWAVGEHLHFEVRQDENSFRKTRNPDLWLRPHNDDNGQPYGVIAGQILDEFGSPIYNTQITIEQLSPDSDESIAAYYVDAYSDWTVNGDNIWGENFALGDLPAGKYRVSFIARGLQVYEVEVLPGQITMIVFDARELEE